MSDDTNGYGSVTSVGTSFVIGSGATTVELLQISGHNVHFLATKFSGMPGVVFDIASVGMEIKQGGKPAHVIGVYGVETGINGGLALRV